MARCSRCGKRGFFMRLNHNGHCDKCSYEIRQNLFSSININLPKPSPRIQSSDTSKYQQIPENTRKSPDLSVSKNILVYDLRSSHIVRVLDLIRENPGILQRDLGKNFDPEYRSAIRELLYLMDSQSLISRTKEKSTYRVYLVGNPSIGDFKMPPRPKIKTPEQRFKERTAWQKKQLALYKKEGTRKVVWDCGRLNGRECPECLAKNGKVYWIDRPPKCPAHIGCTCLLSAVVEIGGENVPVTGE